MLKETLKWLLLVSLTVGLTVGLFGCHGGPISSMSAERCKTST